MYCLKSLCSICLNVTDQLINLNSKDKEDIRLIDKLESCIPGNDQLDSQSFICSKCVQNLNTTCEFIALYKATRTRLNEYISKLTNSAVHTKQHDLKISLLDLKRCGLLEKLNCNNCDVKRERIEETTTQPENSDNWDHGYCSPEREPNGIQEETNNEPPVKINEIKTPDTSKQKVEIQSVQVENIKENHTVLTRIKQELDEDVAKSECCACKTYFKNRLQFILHFKTRIIKINKEMFKKYKCCTCIKSFVNRRKLFSHILTHTENTNLFYLPIEEKKIEKTTEKRPKYFQCYVCTKQFRLKLLYEQHIQSHKNISCKMCPKKFSARTNFNEHLKVHLAARYSCKIYNDNFQNKITLKRADHCKYACKNCERSFDTIRGLKIHQSAHYRRNPRLYSCSICNEKFVTQEKLLNHLSSHRKRQSARNFQNKNTFINKSIVNDTLNTTKQNSTDINLKNENAQLSVKKNVIFPVNDKQQPEQMTIANINKTKQTNPVNTLNKENETTQQNIQDTIPEILSQNAQKSPVNKINTVPLNTNQEVSAKSSQNEIIKRMSTKLNEQISKTNIFMDKKNKTPHTNVANLSLKENKTSQQNVADPTNKILPQNGTKLTEQNGTKLTEQNENQFSKNCKTKINKNVLNHFEIKLAQICHTEGDSLLFDYKFSQNKDNLSKMESKETKTNNSVVRNKSRRHHCKYCRKSFENGVKTVEHYPILQVRNGKATTEYNCCVCSEIFYDKYKWRNHMREHINITYSCSMCPNKFSKRSTYVEHVNFHEAQIFQCTHCYYKFDCDNELKLHLATNNHNST